MSACMVCHVLITSERAFYRTCVLHQDTIIGKMTTLAALNKPKLKNIVALKHCKTCGCLISNRARLFCRPCSEDNRISMRNKSYS